MRILFLVILFLIQSEAKKEADYKKLNNYNDENSEEKSIVDDQSNLSITITSSTLIFYENDDPLSLFPHHVQITSNLEISYILIVLINALDGSDEILALGSATLFHSTNVNGRNVTFSYTFTPEYSFQNNVLNVTGLFGVSEYEAVINTLTYQNLKEEPTATLRGIKITVYDALSATTSSNVFFNVVRMNDSPSFIGQPDEIEIDEESFLLSSISPTYVEIVENTIYDPDIGSQKAIAVLDADTSHGVWSYGNYAGIPISIQYEPLEPKGSIYRNISLFRLCVVLTEQYISFQPEPNFYGYASISLVAWDKTGSSQNLKHGDITNVTWTQKGDPFGSDMATVKIRVHNINDAPYVITERLEIGSVQEEAKDEVGISVAVLVQACNDVDLPYNETMFNVGVAVSEVETTNGVWQYTVDNGTNWIEFTNFSILLGANGDLRSSKVRFIPHRHFYGTSRIKYRCWDFTNGSTGDFDFDSSYTGPEGAFSESEVVGIFTVHKVNNQPYFIDGISSLLLLEYESYDLEHGVTVSDLIHLVFRDDDPRDEAGLAVVGLEESNFGQFQYTCPTADEADPKIWYIFYSTEEAPGYVSYLKPTYFRAILLSSHCSIRVNVSNGTFNEVSFLEVIAWDSFDGLTPGSFNVNITKIQVNSFGKNSIIVGATRDTTVMRPRIIGNTDLLSYQEGDSPVVLFDDLVVSDNNASLIMSSTLHLANEIDKTNEVLNIGSDTGYSNERNLTESTGISVSWNSARTSVTFTGISSEIEYSRCLQSVTYEHLSKNPTTSKNRRFEIHVYNSAGVSSKKFIRELSISSVNNPPTVTINDVYPNRSSIIFNQDNDSLNIIDEFLHLTFLDPDQDSPSFVVLVLDVTYDGLMEYLHLPDTMERTTNLTTSTFLIDVLRISSNFDVISNTLNFSLSGSEVTAHDYSEALHLIKYFNKAKPPVTQDRIVRLYIVDKFGARSNFINFTINIPEESFGSEMASSIDPPSIINVTALPLTTNMLHKDAKYSSGDVIQIFFDQPTNMAPFGVYDVTNSFASFGKSLSKSDVDNLFAFSQSLVQNSSTSSTYTGWWISDTVFQINIISEGYPQPSIKVGQWKVTPKQMESCEDRNNSLELFCIRDASDRSLGSTSMSPALYGNWGLNVPRLIAVVVENVERSIKTSYKAEKTRVIFYLRPALSYFQLLIVCSYGFEGLFIDLKAFNQLSNSFPILSCDNLYLSEWESGLKPSNEIPNLSTLTFVFNSTKKTLLTNDVDVFVKQFNASALITAISEDTGVDFDLYSSYSAATATNNVSILIMQNDNLTPHLASSNVTRSYSRISNPLYHQDSNYFQPGDVITLTFDKATNQANVANISDLHRILTFEPSLDNCKGVWIDARTLEITILESTILTDYITIEFKQNHLNYDAFIPEKFTDKPHCLGISVCGNNELSVGVCDQTQLSCRAYGFVTVRHSLNNDNFVAVPVWHPVRSGVDWWWMLVTALLMIIFIFMIWFLRKQKTLWCNRKNHHQSIEKILGFFNEPKISSEKNSKHDSKNDLLSNAYKENSVSSEHNLSPYWLSKENAKVHPGTSSINSSSCSTNHNEDYEVTDSSHVMFDDIPYTSSPASSLRTITNNNILCTKTAREFCTHSINSEECSSDSSHKSFKSSPSLHNKVFYSEQKRSTSSSSSFCSNMSSKINKQHTSSSNHRKTSSKTKWHQAVSRFKANRVEVRRSQSNASDVNTTVKHEFNSDSLSIHDSSLSDSISIDSFDTDSTFVSQSRSRSTAKENFRSRPPRHVQSRSSISGLPMAWPVEKKS